MCLSVVCGGIRQTGLTRQRLGLNREDEYNWMYMSRPFLKGKISPLRGRGRNNSNTKNATLALHWLVLGSFRNEGLKQCIQKSKLNQLGERDMCGPPNIKVKIPSKANQKSSFNAEAFNKLSHPFVRS